MSNTELDGDDFFEKRQSNTFASKMFTIFAKTHTKRKIASITNMREMFADTFINSYEKLNISLSRKDIIGEFDKQIVKFKNDSAQRIILLLQKEIGIVKRVIGFTMYEKRHQHTYVAQVVVSRDWQCLGFGKQMMDNIDSSNVICGLVRRNNVYAKEFYTNEMKAKDWPRNRWPQDLQDRYNEDYIGLTVTIF